MLAGLWALVNNAGVSTFGEVEFTSMETYKHVSEVNLWGTIRVTKAFLPLVRRAKGLCVFCCVSCVLKRFGSPECPAKHYSIMIDLIVYSIFVNLI